MPTLGDVNSSDVGCVVFPLPVSPALFHPAAGGTRLEGLICVSESRRWLLSTYLCSPCGLSTSSRLDLLPAGPSQHGVPREEGGSP